MSGRAYEGHTGSFRLIAHATNLRGREVSFVLVLLDFLLSLIHNTSCCNYRSFGPFPRRVGSFVFTSAHETGVFAIATELQLPVQSGIQRDLWGSRGLPGVAEVIQTLLCLQ